MNEPGTGKFASSEILAGRDPRLRDDLYDALYPLTAQNMRSGPQKLSNTGGGAICGQLGIENGNDAHPF